MEKLIAHNKQSTDISSTTKRQSNLSSCILNDCCPPSLSTEAAEDILAWWLPAATDDMPLSWSPASWLDRFGPPAESEAVLMQLAPPWQPPEGVKTVQKRTKDAIARLRGLVLLGRAAAELQPPSYVLQVGAELAASLCSLQLI